MYASELIVELAEDPDITSKDIKTPIRYHDNMEGVGIVEAPRGTLIHHYKANSKGIATQINIIVATANNTGPMNLSIKNAAKALINHGVVNNEILNVCEMAFRAYDPCMSCATHSIGKYPLTVNIKDLKGKIIQTFEQ